MTTTGFPLKRDHCKSAACRIPRTALLLVVAAGLAMTGCAGWLPWGSSETTKKQTAKYGQTADQRIAELKKEANQAGEGDTAAQEVFTQNLIQDLLGEHDPRVRCSILEIAAGFDTPAAAAICEGGLQDPDMRVRIKACDVCSQRGSQAVPLLAAALETDADVDVRLQAVRALGDTEDATAIPVLARALEDPDPAIQYRAVDALRQVSGRDLGNDVNAWRTWAADPEARDAKPSMAEAFRRLF